MKIVSLIIAGLGIVFLAIGISILVSASNFKSKAVFTDGTVVLLVQKRSNKGMIMKAPLISYRSKDGQEHTYQSSSYSNPPSYSVGEKVQIYYDPANPDDAQLGEGNILGTIFSIIGGVFSLLGTILFAVKMKTEKARKLLLQTGNKIAADIVSVNFNTSLTVNGKNPFVISCQWREKSNNTVYVFKSNNFWFDPSPYFSEKKQIDVYIDPNDPKKYFMDVSFLPKKG